MNKQQKLLAKFSLALFLAFGGSQLLVTKVTYKDTPVIRPSFKTTVQNLPSKIANFSSKIIPGQHLPPPWIESEIKPTIIAYQPPAYHPPTATPKPTKLPPSPTPLSTATPLPAQPTIPDSPANSPTPPPQPTATPTRIPEVPLSEKKAQLLGLINQERQKHGTSSLGYHSLLNNAAQKHAEDMTQNNYFSHTGRDGSTPSDRAISAGYRSGWVGENIAKGTTNVNSIFNMWMNSSGHRQNMLNPIWKDAGIGFSGRLWVLLLGKR